MKNAFPTEIELIIQRFANSNIDKSFFVTAANSAEQLCSQIPKNIHDATSALNVTDHEKLLKEFAGGAN